MKKKTKIEYHIFIYIFNTPTKRIRSFMCRSVIWRQFSKLFPMSFFFIALFLCVSLYTTWFKYRSHFLMCKIQWARYFLFASSRFKGLEVYFFWCLKGLEDLFLLILKRCTIFSPKLFAKESDKQPFCMFYRIFLIITAIQGFMMAAP